MELKQKHHPAPLGHCHVPAGSPDDGHASVSNQGVGLAERSVFCQHSIHDGHFPVMGLTVGEARRTLEPLLNIESVPAR